MKQNIIFGLLALALVGLFTITKSPAQANTSKRSAEFICIYMTSLWGGLDKYGAYVALSNGSSGAPQIPYLASVPQTLADLDREGYQVIGTVSNDGMILLRKP